MSPEVLLTEIKNGRDGTFRVPDKYLEIAQQLEEEGQVSSPWKASYPAVFTARKVTL